MTTWTINQLDRNTSDGFVTTVHYNVTATDGDFSASTYGAIGFETGTPATPFASLTEAQVIAWVKTKLDEAVVEAALAAQIEAQRNPVKVSGLPWDQEVALPE
jgi:L-aminopeptidase/D-esterase-like protein